MISIPDSTFLVFQRWAWPTAIKGSQWLGIDP
jgi:hypothetical protein